MTKALFYLTFNGIFNNTNGIGTQTKTLLSGFEKHYSYLRERFGEFALHLISPTYYSNPSGYSKKDVQYATRIAQATGGDVHYCPFQMDTTDFWTINNWETLSVAGATAVLSIAAQYSRSLVIAIHPPFMRTPLLVERTKVNLGLKIDSLMVLYGSGYIQDKKDLNLERLGWEYEGISSARLCKDVWLAEICHFMKEHLIEYYGAPRGKFVSYESSLLLDHEDFLPLRSQSIEKILRKYRIPQNKQIILAFGRAEWLKGFDILINNLNLKEHKIHLVLIVVPYNPHDPIVAEYKFLIDKNHVDCTFLVGFNRELPRALCQYQNTKVVVCPSRGDTFSNIPLEVGLWARQQGPVVLCSNVDGFNEQIINGFNGFIFDINEEKDLEAKLKYVLSLDEECKKYIRKNAYDKVREERNFLRNFPRTLEHFWSV